MKKKKAGNKMMTIEEYAEQMGSQEAAAHNIGVTFATVNRWINKVKFPRSKMTIDKLRALGIQPPAREAKPR